MKCKHCGTVVNNDASVYCPSCGKQLNSKAEKPQGKTNYVVIAVVVLAILAIVAAIGFAVTNKKSEEAAHSLHSVPLSIEIPGYGNSDTGIPVNVEGKDLEGESVSKTFYVDSSGAGVELKQGSYTLSFPASPLGLSGLFWKAPSDKLTVVIDDTIENGAPFEGMSDKTVKFAKVDPMDISSDAVDLAYQYAKEDPSDGSRAASYRDAVMAAHNNAVSEKEKRDREQRQREAESGPKNDSPANSNKYTMTGTVTVITVDQYFKNLLSRTGSNPYIEKDRDALGSALNGTVVLLRPTQSCNVTAKDPSTGRSTSSAVGSPQDATSGNVCLKYFAPGASTEGWEKYNGKTVTVEVCFTSWAEQKWGAVYEIKADSAKVVS